MSKANNNNKLFAKSKKIRFYKQLGLQDCGLACLRMIVGHYGKTIKLSTLKELVELNEKGATFLSLMNAAKKVGLESLAVKATITSSNFPLLSDLSLPLIAHWDSNHYVVIYKINNNKVWLADPKHGKAVVSMEILKKHFFVDGEYGNVILLEPTEYFYNKTNPFIAEEKFNFPMGKLLSLLLSYKIKFLPLLLCMLFSQGLNVITPIITQKLFDGGIINQNISFLKKLLIIQIIIYAVSSLLGYFNGVLNNRFSQKINANLIEGFIKKIFSLPLIYFNGKKVSHFLQTIADYTKIESFFTYSLSTSIISLINIAVYSILLLHYNAMSFLIVALFSIFYYCFYIGAFKKRRAINFEKFDIQTNIQGQLIELIEGIQEIKLGNTHKKKIKQWLESQKAHYNNLLKNINISQFQSIGAGLLNKLCYILVTFYTALLTIKGNISIGEMAAIQLIVTQLNAPILSMFTSMTTIQEVGFSMERIDEVKGVKEETKGTICPIPSTSSITLKNVSFSFGKKDEAIIKNMNLEIEAKKITAIVGHSGSGKTTLLKLLLGLYEPTEGVVLLNKIDFRTLNQQKWRGKCGVVLQDGYLFTDSIINNVIDFDDQPDFEKYLEALKRAAIYDFVISLPDSHSTIIGKGGVGLSTGQKQRIMLAKMIYKSPDYIFLDEATNALDASTETVIMNNLSKFFKNKTVVIAAHRLSTIRNADKILVLRDGVIVENGSHEYLLNRRDYYYELVKNQMVVAS